MNKGLCKSCVYKSTDEMSLCRNPVVTTVSIEIVGDDPFSTPFSEAKIRSGVRKKLGLKFAPSSWAVIECNGFVSE